MSHCHGCGNHDAHCECFRTNKVTHTPGPWHAAHNNWAVSTVYSPKGEVARCVIDSEADEHTYVQCEAVKEANARLIAASPDLLEALNRVVNLWDHRANAHGDGVVAPLHAAARAAIRKATGEPK